MSRSWKDVKADKERRDRGAGRDIEAAQEHSRTLTNAYVLGHRLAQLREAGSGRRADGHQSARVSQLEKGDIDQMEVDTIRRYVVALGGQLKIIADFADHDVTVSTSRRDHTEVCA
jgi:hypothetical protein